MPKWHSGNVSQWFKVIFRMILEIKKFSLEKSNTRIAKRKILDRENFNKPTLNQDLLGEASRSKKVKTSTSNRASNRDSSKLITSEEKETILKIILKWCERFARELNLLNNLEEKFLSQCQREIHLTVSHLKSMCVKFSVCPKTVKIHRVLSETWLISNIQKHLKTHSNVISKTKKKW